MIFNRKSGRVPEGNLVNSHFRTLTPQLKMDRSPSSDRVKGSLARQNKLESMPEVLEKEWDVFNNFKIKKNQGEKKC